MHPQCFFFVKQSLSNAFCIKCAYILTIALHVHVLINTVHSIAIFLVEVFRSLKKYNHIILVKSLGYMLVHEHRLCCVELWHLVMM